MLRYCDEIGAAAYQGAMPREERCLKGTDTVFEELGRTAERPEPFQHYTSPRLWNDPDISMGMLNAHLDPSHDAASFRGEFIDKAVCWVVSRFGIAAKGTRICDFGCGPGLWTTRFAEAGATTTGIDLSERPIRYVQDTARQKDLAIRYILNDYLQYSTGGQSDLITKA